MGTSGFWEILPYGAVHLATASFVQKISHPQKNPRFNPSWESAPFGNANKFPRGIFISIKTDWDKVGDRPEFGASCFKRPAHGLKYL